MYYAQVFSILFDNKIKKKLFMQLLKFIKTVYQNYFELACFISSSLIFLNKNPSKDQKAISPKAYLDIMHIGQASNPR